jgi:hypothetical protein
MENSCGSHTQCSRQMTRNHLAQQFEGSQLSICMLIVRGTTAGLGHSGLILCSRNQNPNPSQSYQGRTREAKACTNRHTVRYDSLKTPPTFSNGFPPPPVPKYHPEHMDRIPCTLGSLGGAGGETAGAAFVMRVRFNELNGVETETVISLATIFFLYKTIFPVVLLQKNQWNYGNRFPWGQFLLPPPMLNQWGRFISRDSNLDQPHSRSKKEEGGVTVCVTISIFPIRGGRHAGNWCHQDNNFSKPEIISSAANCPRLAFVFVRWSRTSDRRGAVGASDSGSRPGTATCRLLR